MFLLVFWMALITLMLFYSFREIGNPVRMNFKVYYQRKVAKINNDFGKGTWKKFIKNDLRETYQIMKRISSKKVITSEEYYKLRELVDEMERYIENNIEHSPTKKLDDELEVLRKINTQKSLNKIKERIK